MKRYLYAVAILMCSVLSLPLQSQSRPAITGIAFTRFYTANAEASEKFYSDTLGLQKIMEQNSLIYAINTSQWVEVLPLQHPDLKSRMASVGFTTRDASKLQRYLEIKGIAIEQRLHAGMFSVRDPEGNQIWFVQAGSNEKVSRMRPSPRATSVRMIHAGFVVKDSDKENTFYREILGFRPNWHGGRTPGRDDWISLQVPDGSDWLEYMLNIPADATLKTVGVQDHFSLGTEKMATVLARLEANGCDEANCKKSQMGLDGKVQLNVYDPDLTRVEFMEFAPTSTPCCSPIVGAIPTKIENH